LADLQDNRLTVKMIAATPCGPSGFFRRRGGRIEDATDRRCGHWVKLL